MSKYADLKVAELQDLCRERGLKTARAKADMIATLEEHDAIDELTILGQELEEAPEAVLPVSETDEVTPDREAAPEASETSSWLADGAFHVRFAKTSERLGPEHEIYLRQVQYSAEEAGYKTRGVPFRIRSADQNYWVYKIWVK